MTTPTEQALTAEEPEDAVDFAALLHDNGFTWDDANAVNAILTHERLHIAADAERAARAPEGTIDVDRLAKVLQAEYKYLGRMLDLGSEDDFAAYAGAVVRAYSRAALAHGEPQDGKR